MRNGILKVSRKSSLACMSFILLFSGRQEIRELKALVASTHHSTKLDLSGHTDEILTAAKSVLYHGVLSANVSQGRGKQIYEVGILLDEGRSDRTRLPKERWGMSKIKHVESRRK